MRRRLYDWWNRMTGLFRRPLPPDEGGESLHDLEQELQLETLMEQTAQLEAATARLHPSRSDHDAHTAEQEAMDHAIRRRTLEARRDLVLRRGHRPS